MPITSALRNRGRDGDRKVYLTSAKPEKGYITRPCTKIHK